MAFTFGCVEKKILVRTEPEDVPVHIDDEHVGRSPVEQKFKFYGRRLIRVGPVKNESGKVLYDETERIVETVPPWYEFFPIDFFFEVIWPGTLVDTHKFTVHLAPAGKHPEKRGITAAEKVLEGAEEYRKESLSAIPSQ